jgi:chemotaxis protein methyltransferase CheR
VQLDPKEIDDVCDLIKELCGIYLDSTKGYLIESRLGDLVKKNNCSSYRQLAEKARSLLGSGLKREIVDAITTRETLFFRDSSPYEALQFKALPELLDERAKTPFPRRLRIWSAACSTGQEPYSIGVILHEMIPDIHRWDIQILATDISDAAVAKASRGLFSALEVERGLPDKTRDKYFTRQGDEWRVTDSIRALVKFQQMNLLDPFRFSTPFDVIFCRNVAIYFEKAKKIDLFRRMIPILVPFGYLFVGASESLIDCGPEFRPMAHCRSTFYRPSMMALAKV